LSLGWKKDCVNSSPSEQKKNRLLFDLVIAIGILKEIGKIIRYYIPKDTAFIGALSLEGAVEKVEGMLPALIAATTLGYKKI
jgi:magnesium chelatase family protein